MKRLVMLRRCQAPPPAAVFGGRCCGGVRYGECRRNHAASTGGHAVDGCREFVAAGEEGAGGALRCAACGCHRSFHRRVVRRCHCRCCFRRGDDDDDDAGAHAGAAARRRWDCSPEFTAPASSTTTGGY